MYDESEIQPPSVREAALFDGFAKRLQDAAAACPGLAAHLSGCTLASVNQRTALQTLPVLRKSAVMTAQQANPPFGGFVREDALHGSRIFMSPGPVWEPQLAIGDPWQGARALFAAGIRSGDTIHNAFSYHLTPGGFILDEAARALGCVVFPAGVGNTEAQVNALRHSQASVYVGTPDYLQTLLDHAIADGQPLSSIKRALVSGGALFPAMRDKYLQQGIDVLQCYATADLGVIAYETRTGSTVHPGMLVNEGLVVEILVPGTGMPVEKGQVGEIVVTRLNPDFPLVRFATGDLSKQLHDPSPCGRTNTRLAGWMGRADQRVKVRGMFVDPIQLGKLGEQHKQIDRWRLVVSRKADRDVMHLKLLLHKQSAGGAHTMDVDQARWLGSIVSSLKQATGLSGEVVIVDALPDDGVVVDDQRSYEK